MIKDKFTPLELQEVEELTKTLCKEMVASRFKLTSYEFDKHRKSQPELEEAFQKGLKVRTKKGYRYRPRKGDGDQGKQRVCELKVKSPATELSQEEAWAKFKEIFEANKKKRLLRELQS